MKRHLPVRLRAASPSVGVLFDPVIGHLERCLEAPGRSFDAEDVDHGIRRVLSQAAPRATPMTARSVILLGLLILAVATVPLAGGRLGRLGDHALQPCARPGVAALVAADVDPAPPPGRRRRRCCPSCTWPATACSSTSWPATSTSRACSLLAAGGGLNAIAIAANDGVMPARPEALDLAGILHVPGEFVNSAAVADPKLWFLGRRVRDPRRLAAGQRLLRRRPAAGRRGVHAAAPPVAARACRRRCERVSRRIFDGLGRVEVLRDNRGFRRLFSAQAISGIGDWIFTPAVYAAMVHGDARASELALLLIFQVGPGMLVGARRRPVHRPLLAQVADGRHRRPARRHRRLAAVRPASPRWRTSTACR